MQVVNIFDVPKYVLIKFTKLNLSLKYILNQNYFIFFILSIGEVVGRVEQKLTLFAPSYQVGVVWFGFNIDY